MTTSGGTSAARKTSTAKKTSAAGTSRPRRPTASRSASDVAAEAARQLRDLSGKVPEGISGLERTEDGWKVEVEVVELRRIPATTDVIATYEVTVDEAGVLQGYRRLRRYSRGEARDD